jgi:hypothetical protein
VERRLLTSETGPPNIVLIHGGFVDGSGWADVCRALKKRGHRVSIVNEGASG